MNRRLALAVAVLVLAACGPDDGQPPSQSPGASSSAGALAGPPTIPLVSTVATTGAVSKQVEPDAAASFDLTTPDGTRFHLDVPAGAVAMPTTITMTPLQSIAGFATNTRSAGVRLEPAGLLLIEPARLSITGGIAGDPDVSAWHQPDGGAGELASVDPTGGALVLTHFSDAGIATPTPAGWVIRPTNLGQPPNGPAELQIALDNLRHGLAGTQRDLQRGTLTREEGVRIARSYRDFIELLSEQLAAEALAMATAASVATLESLDARLSVLLGLERQLQLVGLSDDHEFLKIVTTIKGALAGAVAKLCLESHDVELARRVTSLERQLQVLGLPKTDPDGQALRDALKKCFEIDVVFDFFFETCEYNNRSNCGEDIQHHQFRVHTAINGPAVTVDVPGGYLTIEQVYLSFTTNAKKPDDAFLLFKLAVANWGEYYTSYANGDEGAQYFDPHTLLFKYGFGWELPPAGTNRLLARRTLEQWSQDDYRHSVTVVEIFHAPTP